MLTHEKKYVGIANNCSATQKTILSRSKSFVLLESHCSVNLPAVRVLCPMLYCSDSDASTRSASLRMPLQQADWFTMSSITRNLVPKWLNL
jgi:hypothetical protein